ncbi:hypothetical protein MCHIJ_49940 [Mycolicibacterium chitae]|nr:hypothetical protein MCHIJ_49940 [Mycolicibacterium chitae]
MTGITIAGTAGAVLLATVTSEPSSLRGENTLDLLESGRNDESDPGTDGAGACAPVVHNHHWAG